MNVSVLETAVTRLMLAVNVGEQDEVKVILSAGILVYVRGSKSAVKHKTEMEGVKVHVIETDEVAIRVEDFVGVFLSQDDNDIAVTNAVLLLVVGFELSFRRKQLVKPYKSP